MGQEHVEGVLVLATAMDSVKTARDAAEESSLVVVAGEDNEQEVAVARHLVDMAYLGLAAHRQKCLRQDIEVRLPVDKGFGKDGLHSF